MFGLYRVINVIVRQRPYHAEHTGSRQKCETILFRGPLCDKSRKERKNWKDPLLKDKKQNVKIEHNRVVKYLGVYVDDRLHFSQHIKTQRKYAANCTGSKLSQCSAIIFLMRMYHRIRQYQLKKNL